MAIPDKIQCPTCKNQMNVLEFDKSKGQFQTVTTIVNNKRVYLGSIIFLCGKN